MLNNCIMLKQDKKLLVKDFVELIDYFDNDTIFYLPNEIIVMILDFLPLNELIKTELVHSNYKNLIRNTKWSNFIVSLCNVKKIIYVINNYKFANYDFCDSYITNESVKLLTNCHTLNLSGCYKITDESVKLLTNCHTLYLCGYNEITDKSVKLLTNCHTLNLFGCYKITDESVKLLTNCHI